jgi:putative thioredoxin
MNQSPYIFEINEQNYQKIVIEGSQSVPVLVDFWAEWCQPCKMLMPLLAKLVDEYQGKFLLAKLNTEEQQAIAMQFGIRSIPTVKVFKNGQPVDEFMGALPENQIRAFLDKHIPRESDGLLARADEMSRLGDLDGAAAMIEQARQQDPQSPRVLLADAAIKSIQGEIEQAQEVLSALPPDVQDSPEAVSLKANLQFQQALQGAPAEHDLESRVSNDGADSEGIYQLAAHKVRKGDYETALELLLKLLQKDRTYGDDAGRRGMLAVFDIIGASNPLVARYRGRMFNALH